MAYPCQAVKRLLADWHLRSSLSFALQKIQWVGVHYLERQSFGSEEVEALEWFLTFLEREQQAILRRQSVSPETTDFVEQMRRSLQGGIDQRVIDLLPIVSDCSPEKIVTFLKVVTEGLLLYGRHIEPLSLIPDQEICHWLDLVRKIG